MQFQEILCMLWNNLKCSASVSFYCKVSARCLTSAVFLKHVPNNSKLEVLDTLIIRWFP